MKRYWIVLFMISEVLILTPLLFYVNESKGVYTFNFIGRYFNLPSTIVELYFCIIAVVLLFSIYQYRKHSLYFFKN